VGIATTGRRVHRVLPRGAHEEMDGVRFTGSKSDTYAMTAAWGRQLDVVTGRVLPWALDVNR